MKPSLRHLLLLLALALAAPLVRAQNQAVVDTFKGYTASAFFVSYDSTGCIEIDAQVGVGLSSENGISVMSGTNTHSTNVAVALDFAIYDLCKGQVPLATSSVSSSQTVKISADLSSATLTAVVPFQDQHGQNATATINLTWTATGPFLKGKYVAVDRSEPGIITVDSITGFMRNAVATGTISITGDRFYPDNPNIVPLPSVEGSIQKVNAGSVTITLP